MATTSNTMDRRPTRSRACDGVRPNDANINSATAQFSYHVETNREVLTNVEEETLVNLFRESILESLIANHCTTSRRSDRKPATGEEKGGGDPRFLQEDAKLNVLSMFAKEVETTGMSDCPLTEASSLSCDSYISEVTVLYNYVSSELGESTDEEKMLQDDALSTIQQYMENGIYTAQINHELESDMEGTSLEVTALTFLGVNGNPVPGASQNNANGVNTEDSPAVMNASSEPVNPFWIFFGCVVGLLTVVLGFALWRCTFSERRRKRRHQQWKGSLADTHSTTLRTGDEETYDGAYLVEEDDVFDDETPVDCIEAATLQRAESLTRDISTLSEPKLRLIQEVSTEEDEEEEKEYPQLGPEAIYVNTRKCQSTICQACRRASDDDPNYLCPNYYPSEGVAMRSFDAGQDGKSTTSFNIVPPSRVEKSRSANTNGKEDSRLYASPARTESRITRIGTTGAIPKTVEL